MPHSISSGTVTKAPAGIVAALLLFTLRAGHSLPAQAPSQPHVLILGGGSSHNFAQIYGTMDLRTLTDAGDAPRYTESFTDLPKALPSADVLLQASNRLPGPGLDAQRAIMNFVDAGGGLIVAHAGLWYNWPDWTEYNRTLLGGGTRSHDRFGEFEVTVTAPQHPVMQGVPAHFKVSDELYHQEIDPRGPPVEVLATATSPLTGKTYPSIWVVHRGHGRIVCITLGHDEKTHADPAYAHILVNSTAWTAKRSPHK